MRKIGIAFTGGGTGGHVFPGLAVSEALGRKIDADFFWIGSRRGMERRLLAAHGMLFLGIPAGKLRRYFTWKNFFDLGNVLAGILCSLGILFRRRPRLLFSKGGYVSVPPVLAARILGIPVITHESDFDPGLATRINARSARKILVSYPETAAWFGRRLRRKIVVTGNPVRAAILAGDAAEGKRLAGCPPATPLILVLGGSLGSQALNALVTAVQPQITVRAFLVHQTGKAIHPGAPAAERCLRRPFFYEELPHLLAAADLVISRAGANTLWELAAAGKPSVLIPLPAHSSRGDQIRNARLFASLGAAVVRGEGEVTPEALLEIIEQLLDNKERLRRMGEAARGLFLKDPAERIASEVCLLLRSARGVRLIWR